MTEDDRRARAAAERAEEAARRAEEAAREAEEAASKRDRSADEEIKHFEQRDVLRGDDGGQGGQLED